MEATRKGRLKSPNHEPRPEGAIIDTIVLHYTNMESAEAAIARMCDPTPPRVSAHYVVDEDGTVLQLVDDTRTAWHAGLSYWRGVRNLNASSLGIELVNPGEAFGYRPFPEAQITALLGLLENLCDRHPIDIRRIIGHSDIAPERKNDPGELFPWRTLAEQGFGVWPEVAEMIMGDVHPYLLRIGYDPLARPEAMVSAFNQHWCGRDGDAVDALFRQRLAGLLPIMA